MKIDNFKVEDWFNKYEKLAKYDMADTCVESLSLDGLFEIIGNKEYYISEIMARKLNYGDIQGSERLHNAILGLYKNKHRITVTHGAIGANNLVIQTIVERGDKVVSIVPTYQQHYSIPKALGSNIKLVFLKEKNNWLPDLNELKDAVGNNTKLICMNNPNNPTGSVIPVSMLKEIVQIARNCGAFVLSDEVYRGLEHNHNISPSMVDIYEKGISTGSMSKLLSLAGLRLGWIAAPDELIENIIVHREYNTISVSILDDYFSALALENNQKIIHRNLEKIIEGKKIVSQWLEKEQKIQWIEPQGGTTCLLKYDLPIKSTTLCRNLLSDTGVLFLPASTLEMEGYLRAGYCSNLSKLEKGLEIFSQWLKIQK